MELICCGCKVKALYIHSKLIPFKIVFICFLKRIKVNWSIFWEFNLSWIYAVFWTELGWTEMDSNLLYVL